MRRFLPFILLLSLSGCTPPPPQLSPAAQTAWKHHEAQTDLDLIRDIAQDANAQGVLSTNAARSVTLWHRTAITLLHDAPNGWKALVLEGLNSLQTNLSANDYAVIATYVTLAKTVVNAIP